MVLLNTAERLKSDPICWRQFRSVNVVIIDVVHERARGTREADVECLLVQGSSKINHGLSMLVMSINCAGYAEKPQNNLIFYKTLLCQCIISF